MIAAALHLHLLIYLKRLTIGDNAVRTFIYKKNIFFGHNRLLNSINRGFSPFKLYLECHTFLLHTQMELSA